ncbi:MAG: hypothetical protein NTZ20_05170 [Candidatus Levybacteria bacterium]|nr:hypothetical protein [Candidatus Levybacteria bacterium]
MATQLRHDAFARESLMRDCRVNRNDRHDCEWCGAKPARLFNYYFVRDDALRTPLRNNRKLFCNLVCLNSYSG